MPNPVNSALTSIQSTAAMDVQNLTAVSATGQHSTHGVEELRGLESLTTEFSDDNVLNYETLAGASKARLRNAKLIAKMVKGMQKNEAATHTLATDVQKSFMQAADTINSNNAGLTQAMGDHALNSARNQASTTGYLSVMPGVVDVDYEA